MNGTQLLLLLLLHSIRQCKLLDGTHLLVLLLLLPSLQPAPESAPNSVVGAFAGSASRSVLAQVVKCCPVHPSLGISSRAPDDAPAMVPITEGSAAAGPSYGLKACI
jgi:hypothetical protein